MATRTKRLSAVTGKKRRLWDALEGAYDGK